MGLAVEERKLFRMNGRSRKRRAAGPWWRTDGLLVAGGWHPLAGRIRNRIPEEAIEEDYEWEYTEEHILRLKELGVTLLVGQFDRGLSDADQAEEVARAARQAALCHKHGIRHGCYMPNTIYYESVLKESPECEDWAVKTHEGRKTHYGGEQTWRWMACLNSPGWRARMKRQIERAIRVVKTDLLHFDNLGQSLEPESCHCEYCQEAFRRFLLRRYPDARSQKRRFGLSGLETFRIPNFFMRFSPPWSLDRIQSPLLQEWIDFRTAVVTDYIADLSSHARKLNPGVCVDSNGQAIHGNNKALTQGRGDNEGQAAHVDVMWEENPDLRPDDDRRAIYPATRSMRTMLFARRLEKPVITGFRDEEELAYNMTFAGQPGINMHWGYAEPGRRPLKPHQPGVKALLDHYRRNTALYTPCRPASRVAVWRNPKSLAYVCFDTHLSACVMEHVLFTRRVPFSIVQDGFINDEGLRGFDLVILPDVEFVTDEQVEALGRFVERGGGLLLTERTGAYTGEPRVRRAPAFAGMFGGGLRSARGRLKESGDIDESKQFAFQDGRGAPAFARVGKGRAAYLPAISYVHGPRAFRSGYNVHYDGIDSRYWKEPYNAGEIVSVLEWLCPGLYPVKAHGAPELRLDYLETADRVRSVPLVRLGALDGPRDVPFWVQGRAAPAEGALHVPESAGPVALEWVRCGGGFETILPGILRHAVVRYRQGG